MTNHSRIYFTGFMGCGKSTLAHPVATVLGYDSIDLDGEIEQRAGITISQLFEEQGEASFRRIEQGLLQELSFKPNIVIALGGGTVTFENNLEFIKSNGLLVYLKVAPDIILKRVHHKHHRPLLNDSNGAQLSKDALMERIVSLLHQRERYYNQADVTIVLNDSSIALTVDHIVRVIRSYVPL
ncbi:MAG: shikimate kinase [Ignavibacteriae bacterium]|nr:shikimate kinase [Ignavibacteriota bacterium]